MFPIEAQRKRWIEGPVSNLFLDQCILKPILDKDNKERKLKTKIINENFNKILAK